MELSMNTRKEIILSKQAAYKRGSRKEKTQILDNLVEMTQMNRKHIARVLSGAYVHEDTNKKSNRGRNRRYGHEHQQALVTVWEILDYPCAARLHGSLPDALENLLRHKALEVRSDIAEELLQMSSSTMNRLLAPKRPEYREKGKSTTKPGTLLKDQIPVRRGTDWDDAVPGFVEIDLVAHCGSSTKGEYINTLDCTDVASGWTECQGILNKSRYHTLNGMKAIEERLPFPLKGIDSDNGTEFINDHFLHFAQEKNLVMTRSRPNTSNDSCYVEQKNWSVVRQSVGYARFEGEEVLGLLNQFYELLGLYNNFFKASQKLI